MPRWIGEQIRVYSPSFCTAKLADRASELAWRGKGVRIFRWPCGRIVLARIASPVEMQLMDECAEQLLGTWAPGAAFKDVLAELRWARACA